MDFVCASCGKRIHVLTGAATPASCECGCTTWRSCDASATALVGAAYPIGSGAFDVVSEANALLKQPGAPRFQSPL